MNEEVRLSRLRVSRRRALAIGTVGLSGVLAACSGSGSEAPSRGAATSTPVVTDPAALLDLANTCILAKEEPQGPYWFDVDSIRSDIRDGRPGLALALALRVHDVSSCSVGGPITPVANAVVEVWHCDAGGVYSGFAGAAPGTRARGRGRGRLSGQPSGPPPSDAPGAPNRRGGEEPGGGPDSSGRVSDGPYSRGDPEATPTDDAEYLRGAQAVDPNGIVRFTTIYPGWYVGRTTHIHCKVHLDRKTVLTTQLYFDDNLTDEIYLDPPYADRPARDTRNDTDSLYDDVGLLTTQRGGEGWLAAINLGVDLGSGISRGSPPLPGT
jgi:protocatechuate 3,4-dioxygenase beta subunit